MSLLGDTANVVAAEITGLGLWQFSVDSEHPYYLNNGQPSNLGRLVAGCGYRRVVCLVDSRVRELWADYLQQAMSGLTCEIISVSAGESSKTLAVVASLYQKLVELEVDRQTAIVGVGGGTICDISGLVASTYMRGLPLFLVPTTLLAMVDAAIGGKNGVDLPCGKNLIGTFYHPMAVFADWQFLRTLPEREWGCGFVEAVKTALIGDAEMLAVLECLQLDDVRQRLWAQSSDRQYHPLFYAIKRAVIVKSGIVLEDYRESGQRRILNFGHTLGHCLEVAGEYQLFSHGEAVALGMLAALRLERWRCGSSADLEGRVARLWERWKLPRRIPEEIPWDKVAQALKRDKKRRGQNIVFVLVHSPGTVDIVDDVTEAELSDVFRSLR